MKNLGLILCLLLSLNSIAQNAPIDVSAGNNLPADLQNVDTSDSDVAKAKAELENSLIKSDSSSTNSSTTVQDKAPSITPVPTEEQLTIPTPVSTPAPNTVAKKKSSKKKKAVSGSFADDLLMQVDTTTDGQLVSPKKGKVEKKKKTFSIFSERFLKRKRYFQFSSGIMNSRWDKINSNLKKGSRVNALRIVQKLSPDVFLGLGLDFIHAKEDSFVPENIRLFQFRINTEHVSHLGHGIQLISGLGIVVTDYNIRKLSSKTSGTLTYNTYGNGTAFGLVPELGIRYGVTRKIDLDVLADYSYYFSTPQKHFSGGGIHLRASFEF